MVQEKNVRQKRQILTQPKNNELKQRLYGQISVDEQPFELQIELCRNKLSLPPHIWDSYDNETKGKLVASYIIQNKIETLDASYRIIEDMRKDGKRKS